MRDGTDKYGLLRSMSFGQRIAEEEAEVLETYFVETDQWLRLFKGEIDVVYGPKGSGKSALYSLLIAKSTELFDRRIILVPAENPRGTTVFHDLTTDPPTSEREFVGLWKLYLSALLYAHLAEFGVENDYTNALRDSLSREGLIKGSKTLSSLLQSVRRYITGVFHPDSVQGTVEIDPFSQLPKGFTGKITFAEPTTPDRDPEMRSVDELLSLANSALEKEGIDTWILLDRLDVAFAEDAQLESNALRALFRAYLDIGALRKVSLKIFLRTDIWSRITEGGFREASHITRGLTLNWNRRALMNLVIRRSLHNESLRLAFDISAELAKRPAEEQESFFFRFCPDQVDVGPNKPNTFDWLLSRTRDGLKLNAPRELIHLLNSLRDTQVRRLETGDTMPEGEILFARPAFKDALPEVSKVRLEQTLYAEFPDLKQWLEKLRGEKTSQTPSTLSIIWGISHEEALTIASSLITVGFFEKRGTQQEPEYRVPFLYRDSLEMVQGAAD